MTLREFIAVARRHLAVIVVAVLVSTAAVIALTRTDKPTYTATAELLMTVSGGDSATDLNQASTYLERQMTSYARLVQTPLVLDPAIEKVGLSTTARELAPLVNAQVPTSTTLLDISVTADDPATAAELANEISRSTAQTVGSVSPASRGKDATVKATVIAEAVEPQASGGLALPLRVLGGLLGGLLLAAGLTALLHSLDRRIHDRVQLATIAPTIPVLETTQGVDGKALGAGPSSSEGQASLLRSDLESAFSALGPDLRESGFILVMASCGQDVPRQLEAAFTATGRRVTVLDFTPGSGTSTAQAGVGAHEGRSLSHLRASLDAAATDHDLVLVSAPKVGTDGLAEDLSRMADGTVLGVRLGQDRIPQTRNEVDRLSTASAGALVLLATRPDAKRA